MPNRDKKLVFLGVGQVARALAQIVGHNASADKPAFDYKLYGTTRSAERAAEIHALGVEPLVIGSFSELGNLLGDAFVVVSFPPDEQADNEACKAAQEADAIVYISSTAVYGNMEGLIDESTDVDRDSSHANSRLNAEQKWLRTGASIIRAPGIYGGGAGLHHRLKSGSYRLPGDGSNYVSRIHVEDLAAMILKTLELNKQGQIFLSGDNKPTTHREIVEWLVNQLHLPFPESMPLEQCHYTQRGNRKIEATKSRNELGVRLKFPTYKEGYLHEFSN